MGVDARLSLHHDNDESDEDDDAPHRDVEGLPNEVPTGVGCRCRISVCHSVLRGASTGAADSIAAQFERRSERKYVAFRRGDEQAFAL